MGNDNRLTKALVVEVTKQRKRKVISLTKNRTETSVVLYCKSPRISTSWALKRY